MPLNIIRRLVSGQKKRFQDGPDGFDLDLAYISPRVIAMSLPAVQGKEVLYRNPMQEIARFLQTYHSGHAKVYNLCSEHKYSAQHLAVALQQYPFDDHQTPALAMVQHFCTDAAAWLAADPAHVVVVHCKAGKGRTGIMICCLLLYLHKNAPDLANLTAAAAGSAVCAVPSLEPFQAHSAAAEQVPSPSHEKAFPAAVANSREGVPQHTGSHAAHSQPGQPPHSSRQWHPWQSVPPVLLRQLGQPVRDILELYAERRTHDGNGVTIMSQRRYIAYFWAVLSSSPGPVGLLPKPRTVQVRQVTICGLPAGTADSCVLLVEARPSGSLAPRGSRVCLRAAPRALGGGASGLCMVPCAHAPLVQEVDCCSISTDALGDTLTFKMPAASLGLCPLPYISSTSAHAGHAATTGPGGLDRPPKETVADSCVVQGHLRPAHASHTAPCAGVAADVLTAGARGCCVLCGARSNCCCACAPAVGDLPGSVPTHESAESLPGNAPHIPQASNTSRGLCEGSQTPGAGAQGMGSGSCGVVYATAPGCDAGGGSGSTCAEPVWSADVWEAAADEGCCVVEGDVRLTVLRGSARLFHTWFNTAFLPLGGTYLLTRAQLDKPHKAVPHGVSLSVRFVDMQPTAEADDTTGPALSAHLPGHVRQLQQSQQPQHFSSLQGFPGNGELSMPGQALKVPVLQYVQQQDRQQQGIQQDRQQCKQAGSMLAASSGPATRQQCAEHTLQWPVCPAGTDMKQPQSAVTICDGLFSAAQAAPQQQHWHCDTVSSADATAAPAVPISSSAPASPQDRKLRSSGSWRQHLPAISSISTSALLWSSSAETVTHPIPQQQTEQRQQRKVSQQDSKRTSPGSWCGPAGLSWDWESLAAADEGWCDPLAAGAGADPGAAAVQHVGVLPQQHARDSDAFAAGAQGGKDVGSSWQGKVASNGDAMPRVSGAQQQPMQWRSSWVHGKQRGTHSSSTGNLKVLPQGPHRSIPSSKGVAGLVPAIITSQASIELPVIVKRPSGVDSLVDALLDPEHSACPQTSTTVAAAAGSVASGRVLASEASSSAVAGQRPTTGVKPPSQLRKGYSWHGSTGWFTSKATAVNSDANCSSSSSAQTRPQACNTQARPQFKAQDQGGGDVWSGGRSDGWGDNLAAAEAAVLDLHPLLSARVSADVPGVALGSCSDPLQGLLEALNWSTDVQRYHQTDQHHAVQHSGRGPLLNRRHSSSSEPCSPRRHRNRLPSALSSPALQSCKSAPVTPSGHTSQHPSVSSVGSVAAAECDDSSDTQTVVSSTSCRDYFSQGVGSVLQHKGVGHRDSSSGEQSNSSSFGSVLLHKGVGQSNSSSSNGRRRRRLPRAEVCRLLDLEEWVEEEADGVDSGRVSGPCDKGLSGFCNDQGLAAGDKGSAAAAAAAVSPAPESLAGGPPGSPVGNRNSSSAKQAAPSADAAGLSSRLSNPRGSTSGSVARPGSAWAKQGSRSSDPGAASSSTCCVNGSNTTPGVAKTGRAARDLWGSVVAPARPAGLPVKSHTHAAAGPTTSAPGGAAGSSSNGSTTPGVASTSVQDLQRSAAVDESLLGLLAADGAVAPSCAAEAAPVVVQQWQQLEKAWQRSWWV